MRLTLRTLLAYMDDTLDPVHAREIGQKINESPTATKLMSRVRDVMRRRRLTAPKLTGPGAGLDVNTVAEYLDNTAAPERVPDIEKVCLESDMHLAEVGACHQILTLVLGEPADIDSESRQRMYRLIPSEDAPATAGVVSLAEPASAHSELAQGTTGTFAETMPGYLRQPPVWKRALPIAVIVLIVALVGVVFFIVTRGTTPTSVAEAPPPAVTSAQSRSVGQNSEPSDPVALQGPVPTPEEEDAAPADESSTTAPDVAAEETAREGEGIIPNEEPMPTPAVAVPEATSPEATPLTPAPTIPDPNGALEPAARREVAQFLSASGLLLNYDKSEDTWTRLPNRALIYTGDSLLVPPTYRSRFQLESGGELEVVGPTRFSVSPSSAERSLAVRLDFGRVVLRDLPVAMAVSVNVQEQVWDFQALSGGATLAFEVETPMPVGYESTLRDLRPDFRLYVSQGEASWRGAPGEGTVERSSVLTLQSFGAEAGAGPVLAALGDPPAWIEDESLGTLDRAAANRLQDLAVGLVPFDKPVTLPLIESTQDRREEVRTLAVACLGSMGRHKALFEALTDGNPEVRREAVVWLRRSLGRGGEHVRAVRESLADFRPRQGGKNLERLLWGYTSRDLQSGGAEELINYLENDDLPIREVAIYNLEDITGRTMNFQADAPPARRDRSVRQWRQFLEDGKLVPRKRGRI